MDVNGDGKLDIVAVNGCQILYSNYDCYYVPYNGSVGVLLGNGDGTFQAPVTYDSGGIHAVSLAVKDLNGDGKPDVVVTNSCASKDACLSATGVGNIGGLINTTPWPYQAFVRQPINPDGNSTFKANRGVVPVKFTLTQNNAPTCSLPAATISVNRIAGGTLAAIDESSYFAYADGGLYFRIDQTACQYIYNLPLSSLGVGVYSVDIKINGSVVGNAVFALK